MLDYRSPRLSGRNRICHLATLVISTCAIALAQSAQAAGAPHANTTKRDIASAIRSEVAALGLKKAVIAVSVREVDGGNSVVSLQANEPMVPASNMKLLTTGAALLGLSPNFVFRTQLLRDGDRLVVVGDGDPALGDPELLAESSYVDAQGIAHTGMTIEHLLQAWVDAVQATGMKSISEIVVDDRIFAREGPHPLWPKDQLDEQYCSPPFGVNFHGNGLRLTAAPKSGQAPTITSMSPSAPWVKIVNKATSRTGKNDRNSMWVARDGDSGDLTIYGNVKSAYVAPIAVALNDPALFLSQCLASRLANAGIAVGRGRTAVASDDAPRGSSVGPVIQTPLSVVVTRCNVESQNLYAESLMKRLAARITGTAGTWTAGAASVKSVLTQRIGALANAFVISDGSGLSRSNRVTADGMTAWLVALANDSAVGAMFVESLAVGGKSGTVRKRMKDVDPAIATVQCKTGYIDKVSCLSGFVTGRDGTRYAFSVLANNLVERDSVAKAKKLQDRVAKILADALSGRARPVLGG
ncbi:MAG: D-alanyl-D-alanine carboxypeptidase/D-alanyl-D-alanine-endopeptidase [Phycisphaerales bacterium]|nr:D-alanyl-D-alanine carboxypeptidase/D-alanyl-D-alanine-endopeptidase [Phycisphaerales bacterium]